MLIRFKHNATGRNIYINNDSVAFVAASPKLFNVTGVTLHSNLTLEVDGDCDKIAMMLGAEKTIETKTN